MAHSFRSFLTIGVVTITAAAIAIVPSVAEPKPTAGPPQVVHVAAPAFTLTAGVQPLAAASVTDILALIAQHYVMPPSASQPFPTPEFPPVVGGTSIDSTVKNIYNAIEPWVQYGFELATYAVGWIPYVGWLSGQIMIFYHFGERIVRSITFNIADWLGGNISFGQGLVNVGYDTVNAFIQLGIDQWNFWLWPLPPLPPIFPGALAQESVTADLTLAAALDPSTADVGKPETPGDGLEATGKKTAPGQLAKQTTVTEAEATVAEPEETIAPPIKIKKRDAEAATATSGASTKKADDTTNGSPKKVDKGDNPESAKAGTDSGATAASTSPKTGKKDATPKKDRTDNNDNQ